MEAERADVGIIGAGPIGLELAVALKRARANYLQLDAHQIGHTISWFAPQTRFFSSNERIAIAGVPLQTEDQGKCTRERYLAYLRGIVEQFDLRVRTYEPVCAVQAVAQGRDGFTVTTKPLAGERTYRVRRLVLATGGTARPRMLSISGEELPHVSHYFQDPHLYFRRRVLIVGGRNSAVEAALRCYHAGAANVAISYRGAHFDAEQIKYWLLPEINGLVESKRITAYFRTRPLSISPTHVALGYDDGRVGEVPVDCVLLLVGYEADMSLFRMAGATLRDPGQAPQYNEQTMETNVAGLYVAGTAIAGTQGRYRVFIENCHVHVDRIVEAITGAETPLPPRATLRPEEMLET
jgi:thioredoxin reductase (NADPH)